MNVTELARRLKVPTKELLEILPDVGFDIGKRAIKIDDRTAHKIINTWRDLYAQYKAQNEPDEDEKAATADIPQERKTIALSEVVRVKDFAQQLGVPLPKVMAELMKNGVLSSMNEQIDFDTASIIGQDLGFDIVQAETKDEEEHHAQGIEKLEQSLASDKDKLVDRPPVVVVMGHVDHGKTKLLDAIRETNVVEGESGGITQHIGAYQAVKKDKLITFIDTPGHEAFTTMRSRGARIADVAILVVAADDSVQPQTKESIKIIKSAELPMVVAINKIDKPEANPEKVKQDLAQLGLMPEEWGGKTIMVPISAKEKMGLDELLDMILLVAETEEEYIKANPNRPAVGTIIESNVDKGQGPVATLLVQNGTLKQGDLITISDTFYGKIRAMKNFLGEDIVEAGPSTPVRILGLKAAPSVGDILTVTDKVTRKERVKKYQLTEQATAYTKPLETNESKDGIQTLNVVLRADVLGSLEAIISSLAQIEHPEVTVNIIAKGLGNVTDNDIMRAEAGNAIVYGFHVKPIQEVEVLAKEKKVELQYYEVIYHLIEDVKKRLEEMLQPEVTRTDLGRVKVLAIFAREKNAMIVGGKVTKGVIRKGAQADVIRNKARLATGVIVELQQSKVSASEVGENTECGFKFEGRPCIEEGDIIECYLEEVSKKKLES